DEAGIRDFLADALTDAGHDLAQAVDAYDGIRQLGDRPFDLVIVDLNMPGELGGIDVLRRARAEYPETQFLVLTAHGTVQTAVEAMRLGAYDFLQKPVAGPDELRALVTRALNWRATHLARRRDASPPLSIGPGAVDGTAPVRRRAGGSALSRFLWELKRRHVYNVSATYAAVAFIILQSAEMIVPVLPVPAWSYGLLVGLVIGGFPVAIVLGWIFDVTATGWRRSQSVSLSIESGSRRS
ncbi:MAG: response regulator, partial [Gemmatimonadetes bacterium]|nr:response regulator [Gemmatimonadota bacterium]